MKKYFILLLVLATSAFANPVLRGEMTPAISEELVEHFNRGASISISGAHLYQLPKNLGEKIWRINLKLGNFVVDVKTDECDPGWKVFDVKRVCSVKSSTCRFVVAERKGCVIEVSYSHVSIHVSALDLVAVAPKPLKTVLQDL